MPKGKRQPQSGLRPPSLRGIVQIAEQGGRMRVQAWPRPRGPRRNATNQYWTRWLVAVTWLWKYQPAKVQAQLIEATSGTPWMARDPFISAFRGRAWAFTDQTGRTYYPMTTRAAVSQSLDAINQIAGKMLIRGATIWEAVDVPGGGSPSEDWCARGLNPSASSACFKGTPIMMAEDVELSGIGFYGTITANATYEAVVCTFDGSYIVTAIWRSTPWTAPASGFVGTDLTKWFEFPTAVTLASGTEYALMVGRTDGADTFALPFNVAGTGMGPDNLPLEGYFPRKSVRCADASIDVGSTLHTTATDRHSVGIRYMRD